MGFLLFRGGYWANSGRILTFDNDVQVNIIWDDEYDVDVDDEDDMMIIKVGNR